MLLLCETYELKSFIEEPTCYKIPDNLSCIKLIITSNPLSFQNSCVIEPGLSDFHKMAVTVVRKTFNNLKQKIFQSRNYKQFCDNKFRQNLLSGISLQNLCINSNGLEKLLQICVCNLDELLPTTKHYQWLT